MRRVVLFVVISVTQFVMPTLARAQQSDPQFSYFDTGNALFEGCGPQGVNTEIGYSTLRYVVGVTDAMTMMRSTGMVRNVCVPEHVRAVQIYDVVCRYLTIHPETRHHNAVYLVTVAEHEAFPCNR